MKVCLVMNAVFDTTDNFSYPAWEYATPGALRERLNGLTLAGVKTATFDVVDPTESAPTTGSKWIMMGSDGARLAVIEVTEVSEMRIADVPWELADAEGESFRDVAHWRAAHNEFWQSVGLTITDDSLVRCEQFRIIEVLPDAAAARYPVLEVIVRDADAECVSSDLAELDTIGIEEVIGTHTTNGTEVPPAHVLYRAGFVSDLAAATAERELSGDIWRRLEVVIGNEWLDAWRDGFEPVEVGRVLIWPAWQGDPPKPTTVDQIVLSFDPGRAWGTGGHESTKLALRLLQSLPELIDARLLDAGCGSGILSVAAIRLGAAHADGVDTDMSAPEITRNNAVRNFVGEHIIASNTLVGDLAQTHTGAYDVVVANILAPVLIELASDLLRLRKPDAPIVLAGLIDSQIERVVAAYAPLTATRVISDGVWRGLILR